MSSEVKEKGDQLIEKFLDYAKSERPPKPNGYYNARQCAIISVEEIIEHMTQDDLEHEDCHNANSKWMVYWYGVLNYLKSIA